jgi:hypothetical protein
MASVAEQLEDQYQIQMMGKENNLNKSAMEILYVL